MLNNNKLKIKISIKNKKPFLIPNLLKTDNETVSYVLDTNNSDYLFDFDEIAKIIMEQNSIKPIDYTVQKEIRDELEKAKKYNAFIENNESGLKVLKTKKNKNAFKKVIVNENDIAVPNEIIGKLYDKNYSLYFAVEDEKQIKKAKEFLKEHNLAAVMVSL